MKLEGNPKVVPEWRVPPGKQFGVYSPGQGDLKANVIGWPSFPRHVAKTERPMCLLFQVTGECMVNCPNSHILPSAMPTKTWATIGERLVSGGS
jgi:hypothetical protein